MRIKGKAGFYAGFPFFSLEGKGGKEQDARFSFCSIRMDAYSATRILPLY